MANSPARSAIDVGTVIDDTYTIEALIGRGGMGAVFLASHLRLPGKKVAIKVLHADLNQMEVLARFRREAEIASQLGHPNIVEVHDSNSLPDGTPYLVLEYLEGETLAQRIERGPLPVDETLTITRQIAAGLAAAHREGIVHRDLKPQNVFLVPTEVAGTIVEQVKILDFGISKIRGSQTIKTQDSAMLGTPQYMAPEQATGKHTEVDERTDIFALGAIVYEMLCGQPAFTGASVPEVVFKVVYEEAISLAERVPGLDPAIVAAVAKAMEKNQVDRYKTVSEFIEALTGKPTSLIRPPRPRSGGVVGAGGKTDSKVDSGSSTNVSSEDALAKTVGSGDHGAAPSAVADTLASGDHRDSKQELAKLATVATGAGAGGGDPRAPAPPVVAAPRRKWIPIAAVALAAVVVVGLAVNRRHHRKRPDVVAAATADAAPAPVPVPVPASVDAAPPAVVVDAAPPPVVVDAAPPARDARPPKVKPDASTGGIVAPTNPEADDTYDKGLAALAKKPEYTRQMGFRLRDQYDDPRGWVLIGAAACPTRDTSTWVQAKNALKTKGALLTKLYSLCRNNKPPE